MSRKNIFRKLFVSHQYFTIAIKRKEQSDFLDNRMFIPDFVMPASFDNWQADPMLVEDGNTTYLFYEKVEGTKGHIEVAKVLEDGSLENPHIVLESDCHYSYPFVFKHNDNWFLIPESSEDSEVSLYKADLFPYQWHKENILLKDRAVDTTIFNYQDKMILLTFCLQGNTERVKPKAYKFDIKDGEYLLESVEWNHYDDLQVRGAGPVIIKNSKHIRPAQISQEQRYGDGLVFYDVHVDGQYEETPLMKLCSDGVSYKNNSFYVDGLHTYGATSKFEVIDLRGGKIDYLKPIKKLVRKR